MTEVPPIPQQEQSTPPVPPVVMATLVKPAKKKHKIYIIAACVIAFLIFCYIVDKYSPDEEQSDAAALSASDGLSTNKTFNTASARGATREMLGELGRKYGGINVIGGMGDVDDRRADAVFSIAQNGVQYDGLLYATVNADNKCKVTVQMAKRGRMYDMLAQGNAPQNSAGSGQPAAEPLTPHQFPDGSGSINLPAGWNITEANKGTVVAAGQNGDIVELGVFTQVYTQATVGGAPPVMVPWGAAEMMFPDATQGFWNLLSRTGGPYRRFDKIVESTMLETQQNSQKMLTVYDWEMDGKTYRSLGLFIAQPTSQFSWLYYLSSVSAPKTQFTRDLPTLMAIWCSRQVDPGVTTERLRNAAAKLRSCTDIVSDVNANRQRTFDRANDNWTEYFRGQTFVRDANTGETREVDTNGLQEAVNRQNEHEGFNRFNVIPRRDLEP